ncbi:MAG: DUF4199 domain-containing protein [Flavobacteriaceae bacterium]|nr:MAG: DUF4199 domain-containing protein [Flavobacteriaceae bacterium]
MKDIIKKTGINYGLILGFILSLITLYAFAVDSTVLNNWWLVLLVPFFSAIVLGLLAIGTVKKEMNGFITFKEGFTTYFVMIALGLLITTVVSILIYNVVAPEFKEVVIEQQIVKTTEMMESYNIPYEQIDETVEKMREDDSLSVSKQMLSYVVGLAIYSIFGLLLALILKRNNPELE